MRFVLYIPDAGVSTAGSEYTSPVTGTPMRFVETRLFGAALRHSPILQVSKEDLLGCVLGRVDGQLLLSFQKIGGDLLREHPANKCAL